MANSATSKCLGDCYIALAANMMPNTYGSITAILDFWFVIDKRLSDMLQLILAVE